MATLARGPEGARNPRVREYAFDISTPFNIDSVIRPIYSFRDEDEEIVRTPEFMVHDLETLGYMEGDCDDIATFTASLTKSMGFPTRLTGIQSDAGHGEYDHVFSEFLAGSTWFPIDLTVDPGTPYHVLGYMSEVV